MFRSIAVILITIFGLAFTLKDAFYGLLLYNWYSFFSPLELTFGMLSNSKLSLVVGINLILFGFLQQKKLLLNSLLSYLSLAFILCATISLVFTGKFNLQTIYNQTESLLKVVVIAVFSPILITDIKKLKLYMMVVALSISGLASYYGIFGLFGGSVSIYGPGRIGDNNFYGAVLATSLPLILCSISLAQKKYLKLFFFSCFIGTLVALMLTYSRGGFVAGVLALFLSLFNIKRRILIPVIFITAVVVVWLIYFGVITSPEQYNFSRDFRQNDVATNTIDGYISRILTLASPQETDSGLSRTHFWNVAIEMVKDNPVFGVGYLQYGANYERYDFSNGEYGTYRAVHSTQFSILAELGYAGFVIYAMIVLSTFVFLFKSKRRIKSLHESDKYLALASIIAATRNAMLAFTLAASFITGIGLEIFWTLITITITCESLTKRALNGENIIDNRDSTVPA